MKKPRQAWNLLFGLAIAAMLFAPQASAAKQQSSSRTVLSADDDWKFVLADSAGAESPTFDAQSWRTLSIPHDWSIESSPDAKNPTGGSEGYYPAGTGWYRKSFAAPASWKGKRVSIEFDGV